MNISEKRVYITRLLAIAVASASFAVTLPATAETGLYQATFIEAYGGPNGSPFPCAMAARC
jgi:hypothetical protein